MESNRLEENSENEIASFALYRLPGDAEPYLMMQTKGKPNELDCIQALNKQQGFVLAPFSIRKDTPLLVIRPDILVHGRQEIGRFWNLEAEIIAREETKLKGLEWSEDAEKLAYRATFERFFAPLCNGTFKKLVLARKHTLHRPVHFKAMEAFMKACKMYPQLMVYLCYTPQSGCWMGCTPELLLKGELLRDVIQWKTVSLAGTQPVKCVGDIGFLEWNQKNRKEQCVVTNYIEERLSPITTSLYIDGPHTVQAGPVAHLRTTFDFVLQEGIQPGDVLQRLHPTPAVCGLPFDTAYRFIEENEGMNRRYYAGFVGPLQVDGHTALYVNLRCMQVEQNDLILYAGGGILPDSEMESEWNETKEKMKTIENIL